MMNGSVAALQSTPFRPAFVGSGSKVSDQLCELVHYATLAPSSHNTQCWRFRVDEKRLQITVLPDFERFVPIADPDNHHLFVSVGCAVENLVMAANAHGYSTTVDASSPEDGIRVQLTPGSTPVVTDLYEAIPKRQVSRCDYDGKPLDPSELAQLETAGTGDGVRVVLVTDRSNMLDIMDHVVAANTAQMTISFKKELVSWVRFNENEAVSHGDGLYSKCTGNPAIPTLIGKAIFPLVARPASENKKIVHQVKTSAGIAVFVSSHDDPVHWVEVGRCYERFALTATVLGVHNAMLNQPIEVSDARPRFAALMGLHPLERPDLIVRFGRGPTMPISPRRPVEDVVDFVES
jgi:hypothetical protein